MELKPKLNEDMKQTEKSDAPLLSVKQEIDNDRLKAYSSAHKGVQRRPYLSLI